VAWSAIARAAQIAGDAAQAVLHEKIP